MTEIPARLTQSPDGNAEWLIDLTSRIHTAQQHAQLIALNRELVQLYWQIGRDILDLQARQGWGSKVTERLSQDYRTAFPGMSGISPRNLKYMGAFAEAWPDEKIVQGVPAQLPWYHQLALLDKLSESEADASMPPRPSSTTGHANRGSPDGTTRHGNHQLPGQLFKRLNFSLVKLERTKGTE